MDNEKNEPGVELTDDKGRPVTFHYNRERRLAKAPQRVRELYETSGSRGRGPLRGLTASRPGVFVFLSIITLCIMLVLYSRLMNRDAGEAALGNNTLRISAQSSGGASDVTVIKTAAQDDARTGPVRVGVAAADGGEGALPVQGEDLYFTSAAREDFHFSVPFTGTKLYVLLEMGEERVLVTVTPESKNRRRLP